MSLRRGKELKELLSAYSHAYYNDGVSLVTDVEYDQLLDEYLELEKKFPELKDEDSPSVTVGSPATGKGEKITHTTPLLSIENKGQTAEELRKWYNDIGGEGTKVVVNPKFDGITINLQFRGGQFVEAAKRGNGYIGDSIKSAVETIDSIPKTIDESGDLEIRGEGIFYYTPFIEKYAKSAGGEYSNPRNLAAGSFGLLDPEEVKKRELDVIFFDTGVCPEKTLFDEVDQIQWLKVRGFKTSPYIVCDTFDSLLKVCETYFSGRIKDMGGFNILTGDDVGDILCDGLVIKVSDLKKRKELGMTSRGPRWAFAWKFKSAKALTTLEDVSIQVGRTGKLTPVGHIDASIGGTNISRVTLNNIDYIKYVGEAPFEYDGISRVGDHFFIEMNGSKIKIDSAQEYEGLSSHYVVVSFGDQTRFLAPNKMMLQAAEYFNLEKVVVSQEYFNLKIGDKVVIERANDVIPRLLGIRYDLRDGSEKDIEWPNTCPTCGHEVYEAYPQHFCTNINCHDRLVGSLLHFVCRDAMNIEGLGDKVAEIFIQKGFINSLTDLYSLKNHEKEILSMNGFGKTKLEKLYKSIEESKDREFHQFLYSLGINECGRSTSKALSKHFKDIDTLMSASIDDLRELDDIGTVAACSITTFFDNNREIIEAFREIGINMEEKSKTTGNALIGKTFVITGTLLNSRGFYQDHIEKNGGKVSGSVSKKTDYVLIGVDAGSKEDKANELVKSGAPITLLYGHEAFMSLLG